MPQANESAPAVHNDADQSAAPAELPSSHPVAVAARWIPDVPKWVLWGLVAVSVLSIFLSPLEATIDRIVDVAPWAALGLLATEALFIGGLAIMASLVGVGIGWNPLLWTERFQSTISQVKASPMFWFGFIMNTVGGVGTALVLFVGITFGLPVQAWGLLVLPFLDLALTAAVRVAVLGQLQQTKPGA